MMEFCEVPKDIKRQLKKEARDAAKGLRHPSFDADDDGELEVLDLPERSSGMWAGVEYDPMHKAIEKLKSLFHLTNSKMEDDPMHKAIEKWEDIIIYGRGKGGL